MSAALPLVLHDQTGRAVSDYLNRPSQAVILTGSAGVGKVHLALAMAAVLLGLEGETGPSTATNQPYFRRIAAEKDKSSIGIEAVRDIRQFVKLRAPGTQSDGRPQRRVLLLEDAHTLTTEAQNSLLKMLEEPPSGTFFVLTVEDLQGLLPTVRSRSQQIAVYAPPLEATANHFITSGYDAEAVAQAIALAGGLPGLMNALLTNAEHPLKPAVQTARKLLQSTQFERLCLVDGMAKQKSETLLLLSMLQHMAKVATAKTAAGGGVGATKNIRQWHRIMQAAYDAERASAVSAQSKLTLTNLMLSL